MKTLVSNFFEAKRNKVMVLFAALMVAAIGGASASAPASTEGDWKSIITENITSLGADILIVLGAVLTVALGIFALQFGVRKAIKFFKSSTN